MDLLSDFSLTCFLAFWLIQAKIRMDENRRLNPEIYSDGDSVLGLPIRLLPPALIIMLSLILDVWFTARRREHLREMKFVAQHGYSYKWAMKMQY